MSPRLSDIMSTDVATIAPDATAREALNLMRSRRIRHLVVVRNGGRDVLGVVSERDLGGRLAGRLPPHLAVTEVMSPKPVTAKPTTRVREAANLLRGNVVGCLPVLEEGKLRGIVTISDLLDLLGRGIAKPLVRTARPSLRLHAPRVAKRAVRRAR